MCDRDDCPRKGQKASAHLRWAGLPEIADHPYFTKELDMMPDGYHAKPMRIWVLKPEPKHKEIAPTASEEQIQGRIADLKEQWKALSADFRPDPLDFAAYETRWEIWEELYRLTLTAPNAAERTKAASVLLDFSKSRPKQQYEAVVTNVSESDNRSLLRKALELNGLDPEMVKVITKAAKSAQ